MYSIGETAKKLGVATSTLRYYDKEGLIPFVERSSGGARIFSDDDLAWLRLIDCLKKTGMQLKDIRSFIEMTMRGDETIDARLELIVKRRQAVEDQMHELEDTLLTLRFKEWYYSTAKEAGTTALPASMSLDELPAEFRSVRAKLRGE